MKKYKTRHFETIFGQMFYTCFTLGKIGGKTKQEAECGATPINTTIGCVLEY